MRKVQECQFGLGQVPIGEIDLDPKSCDDIPAVWSPVCMTSSCVT